MPYSRRMGYRAERSNAWSDSKYTNQSSFSPQLIEAGRVLDQNYTRIFSKQGLFIKVMPCRGDFLMPLTHDEIQEALSLVPAHFLKGLNAIITLQGSKAQEAVYRSLFAYGRYYHFYGTIILHPFPKKFMVRHRKTLMKPSVLQEFKRAGAAIERKGRGWKISFDERSLKTFYRRDVLIHEIGHHVDRDNFRSKTGRKAEGFAEWFATEFGFRYRG